MHFPILGILGLIFVTLKLCGVIAWSWWLVTLPFWIGFAIFVIVLLVWLAVAMGLGLTGRLRIR